jgi:PTH1 family peptidyl-tRNA hydrolase
MSIDNSLPSPPPSPTTTPITQLKPQSHKQKRLSKHLKQNADTSITLEGRTLTIIPKSIPKHIPPPTQIPDMPPTHLLIASIGNPAPYLNTLHSAGHTILHALASSLSQNPSLSQPPLQKSSREWAYGQLSPGPQYVLWQSPVNMNISGVALATAWRTFISQPQSQDNKAGLVVLHDELEAPLGQLKIRSGKNSPRGHNGLKSIRDKMPGVAYTRIGIGIGRPVSRDPEAVAAYVLGKMGRSERMAIEGCVGQVEEEIRRIAAAGGE